MNMCGSWLALHSVCKQYLPHKASHNAPLALKFCRCLIIPQRSPVVHKCLCTSPPTHSLFTHLLLSVSLHLSLSFSLSLLLCLHLSFSSVCCHSKSLVLPSPSPIFCFCTSTVQYLYSLLHQLFMSVSLSVVSAWGYDFHSVIIG